jgi:hypothetical protein
MEFTRNIDVKNAMEYCASGTDKEIFQGYTLAKLEKEDTHNNFIKSNMLFGYKVGKLETELLSEQDKILEIIENNNVAEDVRLAVVYEANSLFNTYLNKRISNNERKNPKLRIVTRLSNLYNHIIQNIETNFKDKFKDTALNLSEKLYCGD